MNCEEIEKRELVRQFLKDELEGEARKRFKAHCGACASCQASLQVAASLTLLPPLPYAKVAVEVSEVEPVSVWESLKSWLFPSGVGHWQPALAFAVVAVVAVPVLNGVWISTPPEVNSEMVLRGSAGPVSVVEQTQLAIRSLESGDAKTAAALLSVKGVQWDEARVGDVREAYRVMARAESHLGNKNKALKHMDDAKQLIMLDAKAKACIAQDYEALAGNGEFCPFGKK